MSSSNTTLVIEMSMAYLLSMGYELIGFVQGLDWVRQKMIMDMKISQV